MTQCITNSIKQSVSKSLTTLLAALSPATKTLLRHVQVVEQHANVERKCLNSKMCGYF